LGNSTSLTMAIVSLKSIASLKEIDPDFAYAGDAATIANAGMARRMAVAGAVKNAAAGCLARELAKSSFRVGGRWVMSNVSEAAGWQPAPRKMTSWQLALRKDRHSGIPAQFGRADAEILKIHFECGFLTTPALCG